MEDVCLGFRGFDKVIHEIQRQESVDSILKHGSQSLQSGRVYRYLLSRSRKQSSSLDLMLCGAELAFHYRYSERPQTRSTIVDGDEKLPMLLKTDLKALEGNFGATSVVDYHEYWYGCDTHGLYNEDIATWVIFHSADL